MADALRLCSCGDLESSHHPANGCGIFGCFCPSFRLAVRCEATYPLMLRTMQCNLLAPHAGVRHYQGGLSWGEGREPR